LDNKVATLSPRANPLETIGESLSPEKLLDLELAVQQTGEGLARWQAGSFERVCGVSLAGAEITLLLLIGSKGRPKSIKELAAATNRIDIPNIQYSLRKLAGAGLTQKQGAGRSGVTYHLTDEGQRVVEAMQGTRQRFLQQLLASDPAFARRLQNAAEALEELSAAYRIAERNPDVTEPG
jgi:predicted MarR family transcription regulator